MSSDPAPAAREPLGMIAGNGRFPFLVLSAARRLGRPVTIVAIRGEASPALAAAAAEGAGATCHWVDLGELGACIRTLREAGVSTAVMAGQVKHVQLFGDVRPDAALGAALARLPAHNTDALIAAVAGALATHGITLMDSTALLRDLLAGPGALSSRGPTDEMQADFALGYRAADAVAGLDIGQTIVVRDRAVVAVEAMEGTDDTIARAGRLAGPGPRVIKVAKPGQDMRFDVPVVGVATIEAMRAAGADALSVDAGKTLFVDGDEVLRAADAAGIVVIGRVAGR